MKDIAKTSIVSGVLLIIIIVTFLIIGNVTYSVKVLSRTTLKEDDPDVKELYSLIKDQTILRKASITNTNMTNEEIIKFVLDIMTEEDYTTKNITPTKIVCTVTDSISFTTSDDSCKITIIKNEIFNKYQKLYFNTESTLDFQDIKYKGYYCKNSGKKYYCLTTNYTETTLGFSKFDSAYKENDNIVIREYYLNIDINDYEKCSKFLPTSYCENPNESTNITIEDEIIENNGVLYEYVFQKKEEGYYLLKSYIVS